MRQAQQNRGCAGLLALERWLLFPEALLLLLLKPSPAPSLQVPLLHACCAQVGAVDVELW